MSLRRGHVSLGLWLAQTGCVHHIPAPPLPTDAPVPDAAAPSQELTPYERTLVDRLASEGHSAQIEVVPDPRLCAVARSIAWRFALSEELPSSAAVEDLVASAGSPRTVEILGAEVVPRDQLPVSAFQDYVAGLGSSVVIGVAAYQVGRNLVVAFVSSEDQLDVEGSWPAEGSELRVRPRSSYPELRLYSSSPLGSEALVLQDGVAAVPLRAEGWHQLVGVNSDEETTLALIRVGEPAALPALPTPPEQPADSEQDAVEVVAAGLGSLRAAWGLPELQRVDGVLPCEGPDPDELGGVEVQRFQYCATLPAWGGPADLFVSVLHRPSVLQALKNDRYDVLQVHADPEVSTLTVRLARSFERLEPDQVRDRLRELLAQRWPQVSLRAQPELQELAREWAASRSPLQPELQSRIDGAVAAWARELPGTGTHAWLSAAAQAPEELLAELPQDFVADEMDVAVVLGEGVEGEPLYYALAAFLEGGG
jgi:hypothetical protein